MTHTDTLPTTLLELTDTPQWVIWKAVRRNGKLAKIPYSPSNPRRPADTTQASTWGSYDLARSVAPSRAGGIGFVFTADDPYIGVDLDNCIRDGDLAPGANEIVARLSTYTETTPSGSGIHCIGRGEVDRHRNRTAATPWGGSFEVYDRGRYFTMGMDGSGVIGDCQGALSGVCEAMFGPSAANAQKGRLNSPEASYEELLTASQELGGWGERECDFWSVLREVERRYLRHERRRGEQFAWFPSRSEAEAAVVYRLIRNGASDRQLIEFADAHLWKHIEESKTRGNRYIDMTIRNERCYVYAEEGLVTSPEGGWPKKRTARHRWTTPEQHDAAFALVSGQLQASWIRQLQAQGINRQTAYRVRDRLRRDGRIRIDSTRHVHRV